ncbi:MAG: hypothetical protein J6Q73_07865 [Bacteroidaceae bacterium]|nr:hypothetical protein [Bacteroidaceae bacterium]
MKEEKITFAPQYNFQHNKELGRYFNSKHNTQMPYNLYIATNYYHQTLEIEFSSKILKERYSELISRDTIRKCLENINDLGICTIDVDGILRNSWVIRADITKDVDLPLTDDVLNALNDNVGNYRRYTWQHYDGKGITFTKNVMRDKDEITVYNKYTELLQHSRNFMDSLPQEARNKIMDYFYGKTRFEVRMKNSKQIEERLGVNRLMDFFNSVDNVVREQFNRVFDVSAKVLDMSKFRDYDEWAMAQILNAFNGDLRQIEQMLRSGSIYNSRNGLTERMKKFESVKLITNKAENEILKQVRSLL